MKLVLGVSGSISAYRAVDLLRRFQKDGHEATVVMTAAATRFVAPLTFAAFAPQRVFWEMFAPGQDPLLHVHLAAASDLLLVAPASADIIGKMANGIADDLLSTVFCAFRRPVAVAPAMNSHMLDNPAVADNIARLRGRGVALIEPGEGELACQESGRGRLAAVEDIYRHCLALIRV